MMPRTIADRAMDFDVAVCDVAAGTEYPVGNGVRLGTVKNSDGKQRRGTYGMFANVQRSLSFSRPKVASA
jgi:hypothetical protein